MYYFFPPIFQEREGYVLFKKILNYTTLSVTILFYVCVHVLIRLSKGTIFLSLKGLNVWVGCFLSLSPLINRCREKGFMVLKQLLKTNNVLFVKIWRFLKDGIAWHHHCSSKEHSSSNTDYAVTISTLPPSSFCCFDWCYCQLFDCFTNVEQLLNSQNPNLIWDFKINYIGFFLLVSSAFLDVCFRIEQTGTTYKNCLLHSMLNNLINDRLLWSIFVKPEIISQLLFLGFLISFYYSLLVRRLSVAVIIILWEQIRYLKNVT